MPLPDAFVVMYSVIDKASFQRAEEYLARLHDQDLLRGRPAILVGNKVDLVRSRVVSPQGKKQNIVLFYTHIFSWLDGFMIFYKIERLIYDISDKNNFKIKIRLLCLSVYIFISIFFFILFINIKLSPVSYKVFIKEDSIIIKKLKLKILDSLDSIKIRFYFSLFMLYFIFQRNIVFL